MRSVMYKSLDRPGFQLQPASGFQVKSKFPNSMNMKHFKFVKDTSFRSALLTLSSGTNTNANRRNANIFHNIKIQTQTQTQMQIQIVGVRTLSTIYEYKHKRKYKYQLQECNHCPPEWEKVWSRLSSHLQPFFRLLAHIKKKIRQKIPC